MDQALRILIARLQLAIDSKSSRDIKTAADELLQWLLATNMGLRRHRPKMCGDVPVGGGPRCVLAPGHRRLHSNGHIRWPRRTR